MQRHKQQNGEERERQSLKENGRKDKSEAVGSGRVEEAVKHARPEEDGYESYDLRMNESPSISTTSLVFSRFHAQNKEERESREVQFVLCHKGRYVPFVLEPSFCCQLFWSGPVAVLLLSVILVRTSPFKSYPLTPLFYSLTLSSCLFFFLNPL